MCGSTAEYATPKNDCRSSGCCCSIAQLCPTLCDPMDWSTPGFPVLHHLLELAQTHVHWVNDATQTSHPLSPSATPAFNLSQHQGIFSMSWLFTPGGQNIGASASASVLPMNIQGWFPSGLTGLISLQFNRLSKVFSSTAISICSSVLRLLYGQNFTSLRDY